VGFLFHHQGTKITKITKESLSHHKSIAIAGRSSLNSQSLHLDDAVNSWGSASFNCDDPASVSRIVVRGTTFRID
jgi:hypothetical protein